MCSTPRNGRFRRTDQPGAATIAGVRLRIGADPATFPSGGSFARRRAVEACAARGDRQGRPRQCEVNRTHGPKRTVLTAGGERCVQGWAQRLQVGGGCWGCSGVVMRCVTWWRAAWRTTSFWSAGSRRTRGSVPCARQCGNATTGHGSWSTTRSPRRCRRESTGVAIRWPMWGWPPVVSGT